MSDAFAVFVVLVWLSAPVWVCLVGPFLTSLVFFNVAYVLKVRGESLHGNYMVGTLQVLFALPLIWIPLLLLLFSDDQLINELFPPAEMLTPELLQVSVDPVHVSLWVGTLLWPGLFLTSRFVLTWSSQYGFSRSAGHNVAALGTWLIVASVLLARAHYLPESEMKQGLFIAAAVAFPIAALTMFSEFIFIVALVTSCLYAWAMATPPGATSTLEFMHVEGGFITFMMLMLPMFCVQVAIEMAFVMSPLSVAYRIVKATADDTPLDADEELWLNT